MELDQDGTALRSEKLGGNLEDVAVHGPSGLLVLLSEKKAELGAFAARTKSRAIAAEAENFDNVMQAVSSAPAPASAAAQDMIKEQKARAFTLRR